MALNFPNSPAVNDEYSYGGFLYRWDGVKWTTVVGTVDDLYVKKSGDTMEGDLHVVKSSGTSKLSTGHSGNATSATLITDDSSHPRLELGDGSGAGAHVVWYPEAGSVEIMNLDTQIGLSLSDKIYTNAQVQVSDTNLTHGLQLTPKDWVLANSAPAGFGLGGWSSSGHPRDFNQIMSNGWYEYNADTGDTNGPPGTYGNVLTLSSGNAGGFPGWAQQIGINTSGAVFTRHSKAPGSMDSAWAQLAHTVMVQEAVEAVRVEMQAQIDELRQMLLAKEGA